MKPVHTLLLLILVVVLSVGCSSSEKSQSPDTSTMPVSTTSVQQESDFPEDIKDARQVVYDYWDAFNSYDVERVLTFLEDSYRQEREEDIRDEIGKMDFFNVKLTVEEEAEPVITPDGIIEIYMSISTPIGLKHVTYGLVNVGGVWKILSSIDE